MRRPAQLVAVVLAGVMAGGLTAGAGATTTVVAVSADPYANTANQHRTQVEPDSFSYGGTVVAAFQSGRNSRAGSSNIGWARSLNAGATWSGGFLPSLTANGSPVGRYLNASDPAVAYDAVHDVWLIASLGLGSGATAVTVSRSTDGAATFQAPVVVDASRGSYDKEWVVCDNGATSPFRGRCYVTWDDNGDGDRLLNSTSLDGGLTWTPPLTTPGRNTGLGGQPLVQPNGTVVVPLDNSVERAVLAYRSLDGGATWTNPVTIAAISAHKAPGALRSGPLPSAAIDAAGKVYVAWQDCRFRRGCPANDIVLSTSVNGTTWTAPVRVPIDPTTSPVEHVIPGLGVDPATSGTTAALTLIYYYFASSRCATAACTLGVGVVRSADGGATWSAPAALVPLMTLGMLPSTALGRMVGDYTSVSYVGSQPVGVFAAAVAGSGGYAFNEAIFAVTP